MNQEIDSYPGLKAVSLEIGYDNGIINRDFSDIQWLSIVDTVIGAENVYHGDLQKWSDWLSTRTEDQILTIAAGEDSERMKEMKDCPDWVKLDSLLDDIFMSSEI